ncbi:hypothetical protein D9M68_579720 [compost metagenome]
MLGTDAGISVLQGVPQALRLRAAKKLGTSTNRGLHVVEVGAGEGGGTATNLKGSVTRSRDNYLENRRQAAMLS